MHVSKSKRASDTLCVTAPASMYELACQTRGIRGTHGVALPWHIQLVSRWLGVSLKIHDDGCDPY